MLERMESITERADPAVQRIIDLRRRARRHAVRILVEESEPLMQALRSGVAVREAYVDERRTLDGPLVGALDRAGVPVRSVAAPLMRAIFPEDKCPGVFAVARAPRPARLESLAGLDGDIVVLDGVRITGNIGAIVRTSFALGASGVVLVGSGLESVADPRLIRASRGIVFALPVVLAEGDTVQGFCREHGIGLTAFDMCGTLGLGELASVNARLALVMGSERHGVSTLLGGVAGRTVRIPMRDGVESLNVSVAAGVALSCRLEHNRVR